MSDDIFSTDKVGAILEKIKKDKTGRLGDIMQQLMDISERAGRYGFDMKDISIIVTTGWYLSQNPEMKQFFEGLKMAPPIPDGDDDIYN